MKILIACAGTGGHINPAIAMANMIKKKYEKVEILFVGTSTGLENELVRKAGYEIEHIRAGRLLRKISIKNIKNIKNALFGVKDAIKIIKEFKPNLIIGTGGYIFIPIGKAAKMLKVKYILHESNAFPGLAVKLAAKKAEVVLTGFEATISRLPKDINAVFTGTPVKFDSLNYNNLIKEECKKELDLLKYKKIIFVTGGSQGARKLNNIVIDMIKKYKSKEFFVVLATGINNYDEVLEKIKDEDLSGYLRVERYIYEIDKMYKVSDMLITRAGALTVTEIATVKKASILIPLPTAAENHQYFNAKTLEDLEASVILNENSLNEDVLYDKISSIIKDDKKLIKMGEAAGEIFIPDVETKIMEEINKVLRG